MELKKLLSASVLIAIGMLAGRALGFFREMLLAAQFGAGNSDANIAIAMLLIPDFITALLIGSSISAVLVPAFAARNGDRALALLWQCLGIIVPVFAVIGVAVGLLSGSGYIGIALCSLPISAATGVFTAYLQYKGKFLAPAFSTVIFNAVILAALWFLPTGLLMLSCAVVFASLTRFAANCAALMRGGEKPGSGNPWELNKALALAYAQNMVSNILGIFILYTPFAMIAFLNPIEFALFNYAFKLITFPAALIQTIIQMSVLPWFVNIRNMNSAMGNSVAAREYGYGLQAGWVISLSVSLCVWLVAHDIALVCFGHGKMTARDTAQIGELLAIGIWALPCMVMLTLWQQIFYAYHKQKAALFSNVALALFIVPLCWVGYIMDDRRGLLYGFVAAQVIPFLILALAGKFLLLRSKASLLRVAFLYAKISLAVVFAFIPFAMVCNTLFLDEYENLALATGIGGVCIFAGLYSDRQIRNKIHKAIADKYLAGV
jgi:peptidoglycan biosynthesis protein MviN/MurJ (putative lipid II flippase)